MLPSCVNTLTILSKCRFGKKFIALGMAGMLGAATLVGCDNKPAVNPVDPVDPVDPTGDPGVTTTTDKEYSEDYVLP